MVDCGGVLAIRRHQGCSSGNVAQAQLSGMAAQRQQPSTGGIHKTSAFQQPQQGVVSHCPRQPVQSNMSWA